MVQLAASCRFFQTFTEQSRMFFKFLYEGYMDVDRQTEMHLSRREVRVHLLHEFLLDH